MSHEEEEVASFETRIQSVQREVETALGRIAPLEKKARS